jgi:hypothetical protein
MLRHANRNRRPARFIWDVLVPTMGAIDEKALDRGSVSILPERPGGRPAHHRHRACRSGAGRPQSLFVASLHLSNGAVSQAVNRVWRAFIAKNLPPGYEWVTVVLPEHQAFIVKKWAEDAATKRASKK